MEILIGKKSINTERLLEQLHAALDSRYGIIQRRGDVIVYAPDDATVAEVEQVRNLTQQHNPAELSPRQQAEQQRQEKLAAMREDYRDVEVDPADYGSEKAIIQALAQKLAWLEQEVIDLRGGQV